MIIVLIATGDDDDDDTSATRRWVAVFGGGPHSGQPHGPKQRSTGADKEKEGWRIDIGNGRVVPGGSRPQQR
jgi:hypothetical protein